MSYGALVTKLSDYIIDFPSVLPSRKSRTSIFDEIASAFFTRGWASRALPPERWNAERAAQMGEGSCPRLRLRRASGNFLPHQCGARRAPHDARMWTDCLVLYSSKRSVTLRV